MTTRPFQYSMFPLYDAALPQHDAHVLLFAQHVAAALHSRPKARKPRRKPVNVADSTPF